MCFCLCECWSVGAATGGLRCGLFCYATDHFFLFSRAAQITLCKTVQFKNRVNNSSVVEIVAKNFSDDSADFLSNRN